MASTDDQARLLDEASAVVKEQAFYMKRAIDNDSVREALKHGSNMVCELRTSLLSPKNYYELYMQVFQEMQHLAGFFGEKGRHGRKMVELYESVQHAGNILPRLYLLATVGASYIKSKEAPAKEILTDIAELCKGVQHPLRGLFLRYYVSQMLKDKLPDTGSDYEGEGGNISDAFEFIFTSLDQSNRLWVRIQSQGPARDKPRREKERHDLRVLVGANLVRLSQLEGMTLDFYRTVALPRILEHIVSVRDTMSQQYLFESMIQVFPDDFHIHTLEDMLKAYTKASPNVDMKPIMVTLMNRLANYMQSDSAMSMAGIDIFSLFRTHLQAILERILEPAPAPKDGIPGTQTNANAVAHQVNAADIGGSLEVQAAFMSFTISLYPDKIHYVDMIMESSAEVLRKYFDKMGGSEQKLTGTGAEKVVDLLAAPLKTLGLRVLEMDHYSKLFGFLTYETRKAVASSIVNQVVEQDTPQLASAEAVQRLFSFIQPLIRDEEDQPQGIQYESEAFVAEQRLACRLVHQISSEDTDVEFAMLQAMRGVFGQGGPHRMKHTLEPVVYHCVQLVPRIQARVDPPPAISVKKVFQFMHKTISILVQHNPEAALTLWLVAASVANTTEVTGGNQGAYEPICHEFLTQALLTVEEEISETEKQFKAVAKFVGVLSSLSCLEEENYVTVATKVTQNSGRLIKKPLAVRAIAQCSNLYWNIAKREGKRVVECLQKCLKITEAVTSGDSKQVGLWVEILDKYIYFFESQVPEVSTAFISTLVNLCKEHIEFAETDCPTEANAAKKHLQAAIKYCRLLKTSEKKEVAERFAELEL